MPILQSVAAARAPPLGTHISRRSEDRETDRAGRPRWQGIPRPPNGDPTRTGARFSRSRFWERHVDPTTHLRRARLGVPSMLRQEAIRPAPSTAIWNGTSLTASNAAFTTRQPHRSRPIPPTKCGYPRQCSPAAIRRIAHMIDSRTHVRRTGLPVRVGFDLTHGSAHLPRWNRRVRTQSVTRKCLGHAWVVNLPYRPPHGLPLFGRTAPRTRAESVMPCSLAIPALHDGRIGFPRGNGDPL